MPARNLAAGCALAAVCLSACGSATKPVAGSATATSPHPGRGVVDDPRTKSLPCLRKLKLAINRQGAAALTIGAGSQQARVMFMPTPGAAQEAQISGQVQSAEVIGSALLFPQAMSDRSLKKIEDCLAQDVLG